MALYYAKHGAKVSIVLCVSNLDTMCATNGRSQVGRSQVARRRFLVPCIEGSNPSVPDTSVITECSAVW